MLMRVDKGNELKRKGGKNRQQGRYTGQESKLSDARKRFQFKFGRLETP